MLPKLGFSKIDRCYVTPHYFATGHFLLKKSSLNSPLMPKIFKAIGNLLPGTYGNGIQSPKTEDKVPDCEAVIPKLNGYRLVDSAPIGVNFRNGSCDEINAYIFMCPAMGSSEKYFKVGIQPGYVPILRTGNGIFAKDEKSPVLVLSDNTLNGDLIAVVMPIRLNSESQREKI